MGNNLKKIAAMAIISMTVVSAITGCSQDTDSAFQTLDVQQSNRIDIPTAYDKNTIELPFWQAVLLC